MQKMILTLTALLLLTGCDRPSGGPLTHALTALHDGNYEDFLAAKKESDEEIQGAIQPSDDLCLTTPRDFTKYGVQHALAQLDHKGLFALPAEDRFLYAVKVAGVRPAIAPESFLQRSPMALMNFDTACRNEQDKVLAAMQSDGGYSSGIDEARLRLMRDWMTEFNDKHGDKIDEKMHAAVEHMDAQGYTTSWPAPID